MCGINGIISKVKLQDMELRITKMNNSLVHRGPDAGGVLCNSLGTIGLAHRRLSIIDLDERSSQPMVSDSGRWTLVYNGEIYNYKELRDETEYNYKTYSDTEVILAYIENFGIEKLLEKSNGMFAFAAYDRENEKMYLCRDRLGIKPLYYYFDDKYLVFSSEIKGLLNSGLIKAELDEASIDEYLGYRYVREPYTFFKNIFQIESGMYMCIDKNFKKQTVKYWDVPNEFNMNTDYDEVAITKKFQEKLECAVLKRMVSDVPLGTYLSGGVDSSVLTAIVALNSNHRINTYTIGFSELNEFEYSDVVADKYNTAHHKILMNSTEYFENMKEIISYKDAPLGVPNEIPLAVMSKKLKEKITVVLSGEGADELLGGYGRIFRSPFEYENSDKKNTFYEYFIQKYEYVPRVVRDEFLDSDISRRKEFDKKIAPLFRSSCNEHNVFRFFHKYHVKGLLQRVDTTTMLTSVEARVPFLDHDLVEFAYREIPYDLKLKWNDIESRKEAANMTAKEFSEVFDTPKYLLRKVAENFIPKELINRKKVGFPVPLEQWNEIILPLLQEKLCNAKWLKQNTVDELIDCCKKYSNGNQLLWMFFNVQMFVELYFNTEWRY